MFFTIVVGIVLIVALSRLKQLRQSAQGEIFCGVMFVIEILQCVFRHTIRIFSKNAVFSVILMILLPFVILFAYYAVSGIINQKKNQNSDEKGNPEKIEAGNSEEKK